MKRKDLIRSLTQEIDTNARLIDYLDGGECLASAMIRAQVAQARAAELRPYLRRLAPVDLRPDGSAPEEYRLHVPPKFRAPVGSGLPIDAAVSEIRSAGIGFDGETWDELALWLEDHAESQQEIRSDLNAARESCNDAARAQVPDLVARIKKAQRLIDRLEGCKDRSRGACLGRVALALERNLSRASGMRRYWRQVRSLARTETAG